MENTEKTLEEIEKNIKTEDIKIAYQRLKDRYSALGLLMEIYPPEDRNQKIEPSKISMQKHKVGETESIGIEEKSSENSNINSSNNSSKKHLIEKMVVTDLFVEKDIMMLENRAKALNRQATALYVLALALFFAAAFIALLNTVGISIIDILRYFNILFHSNPTMKYFTDENLNFTILLIKSFTLYGLLILIGVTAWKHSKAKYDQAERLYAKRRQNRQLRLYVHLNDGKIKHKEYLEFLKFARDEENAYQQVKAEAKAPLGNLISDILKAQVDIIKAAKKKKS
jgi:hypothetical protein